MKAKKQGLQCCMRLNDRTRSIYKCAEEAMITSGGYIGDESSRDVT